MVSFILRNHISERGFLMNYYLDAGCWGAVFAVPNAVADSCLKLASGSAVKVLLFMLRNSSKKIEADDISNALNISTDDVKDAFSFWEEMGILKKGGPDSENIQKAEIKSVFSKQNKQPENTVRDDKTTLPPVHMTTVQPKLSSASYNILPTEIESMRQNSKEMQFLFDSAQQIIPNFNTTTLRSVIWIHEYLGLPAAVIIMLITYCAEIGKTSYQYIESVAVSWSSNNINTTQKADEAIQKMKNSKSFNSKMMQAFGLKRDPTPKQKEFFSDWQIKGYSVDLINCACERAVDQNKTLTVNYVNGILENWNSKGITTREQADAENKPAANKNQPQKREQSYDNFDVNSLIKY